MEVMKEVVIHHLTEQIKMLKKCRIWCIQTVNQAYYVEILKQLHEAVCTKRHELWPSDWMLHHDNAPIHKVLPRRFWPKNPLLKWNTQITSGCFQK
jgi:hypothetical protein